MESFPRTQAITALISPFAYFSAMGPHPRRRSGMEIALTMYT